MEILEVAPRDGLQNEETLVSTADKVELIARAVAAGVRRVEAVSFVNPKLVPQMADADAVMAAVPRVEGVSYSGLVLNPRGLERAVAAGVHEVNVVVVATETLSLRNQNRGVADMVKAWSEIAREARSAGLAVTVTVAAAFGCPFEGEVSVDRVLDVASLVAEAGPDEIALADTIGVGTPDRVRSLLEGVRRIAPDARLRCHFHNTRNTGYANAVAAVEAGVDTLDASIGGIGGCPFAPDATGNIATEDLLYALDRMGVPTGLGIDAVIEAADWLGGRLGKTVPALLGKAGVFPRVDSVSAVGARRPST